MRGKKRRVETCVRRYEQHESFSDVEEFYMKKILTQYAVCALAVALMVPLAHAQSLKQNSCEVKRHFLSAGRCQFYARP